MPRAATNRPKRIVVGITAILRQLGIETHLIMSKWALATMKYETSISEAELRGLATRPYTAKDLPAPIASGSFQHDGMMIVPCRMKTLAAIWSGYCDDLISRTADLTLKEDQNLIFLRQANATIFLPVPAFYNRPKSIEDMVHQSAGRMLDLMGIFTDGFE
ncbi:flavo protein [Fusarium oxysporum Fo47]|uniref:flavo protein n=1 Tax=Fusarium oxysporum Fo47 TaxID=660027 RepID=UPI002869A9F7|nr:flavo protein [Fusarium oxysporum Fo47]WJG37082.1 flavo protein [Fusarium oxysporum Fo47]